MKKTLPRGIRNNNPGNIEWGDPWQGLRPKGQRKDARFAEFESPAYGIRALARTLITYQDKHKIRTVKAAINRWAPPVENNTSAYVAAVQKAVGGDQVDLHDYQYLRPMVEAIILHENGKGPVNSANTWYDSATVDEGLRLAGVRKPTKGVASVPATKETVGATVTGFVGVAELAEAMPNVVSAIKGAEGHLTSGNILQILIGTVLVTAAVFIAYSQVKRYQSGQQ